jgi:threonine 3-dehydrogenase
VRVHSCALCGTDRGAFINGSNVIPGHEISGTVVECGSRVDASLKGERGVVYLVDYCGACAACRARSTNMCLRKRGMYGFTADGGYADCVAVRAQCWLPVSSDIALDEATMLLDLLGTSGHAFRRAGSRPGRVAVLGCGPIGLGAIVVGRALGAGSIHAIDISSYRLDLARRLGAEAVDAANGDPLTACLAIQPDGYDVVVEAAGATATQQQAIKLVAAGGRVVFVAHNRDVLPVDTLGELIQFEKTLLGSEYFPIDEFADNHTLLRSGRIQIDCVITHRFPLDDIAAAFDRFMSGDSGKVLVQP